MGYLNKATITVDAILTNRGRELLAKSGNQSLNITKFAVADDEVDYGLYNTAHPEGTEYYGSIIENMPVLEATPDEQQIMRYKLVTLQSLGAGFVDATAGTIYIPQITGFDNTTLTSTAAAPTPSKNFPVATTPSLSEGYTLIVADATLFNIYSGGETSGTPLNTAATINSNGSITLSIPAGTGPRFTFVKIAGKTGITTATLFGTQSGATGTITITVN